MWLAAPLSPRMAQRNSSENASWRPAVARAVPMGRAMAMFLGTSSPKTMEKEVAMSSARTSETVAATEVLRPIASNSG